MNKESKTCQNCKQQFTIESDDFSFYEKIQVVPPKTCPLCRAQWRLSFRNERVFYKRPCDKCKREVISMYSPNKPYTVWCYECWFSDDWDAREYGQDYDPACPFFEQLQRLWDKVPKIALIYVNSVNSEYVNISADNKNCYMIIESSNNEDCTHCYWIQVCRNCVDVSFAHETELSYEADDCYNCYKVSYSKGAHECRESAFLLDCRNCSNCVGCVNMRNKKYCVFNKQLTREEYEQFLNNARLDTYSGVEKLRKQFTDFLKSQPRRFGEIYNAPHSTGNYIKNASNCQSCFHSYDAQDCKYCVHVWRNAKDCMDTDTTGRGAELMYNSMNAGMNVSNYICSTVSWSSSFLIYSSYCFGSMNCLGSIGLRQKEYCILNKQYSKEEYMKFKSEIIRTLREEGRYGDFFPQSFSAFGYNETAAQEQFPLTKEQALAQGYAWEDHSRGTYGKETVSWDAVADSIGDVPDTISKEVFACSACKKNYRIIPTEFSFYKNLKIPLPRLCPDCRHIRRFQARGPNRLWHRTCMCGQSGHFHGSNHCPNEFETSYPPDSPCIVYCEQCYQAEVV